MFEIYGLASFTFKGGTILRVHVRNLETMVNVNLDTLLTPIITRDSVLHFVCAKLNCSRDKLLISDNVNFKQLGIIL